MSRSPRVVALATALVVLCPALSFGGTSSGTLRTDWSQATGMSSLLAALNGWLDARVDWPRRPAPPQVRFVSPWQAAAHQGAPPRFQRGALRGLYDPQQAEILLVRPWDPRNADHVSVLLHELVHHRQAPHPWYCAAAQEPAAYRLQSAWLAEQGLSIDVNWLAVTLDAGCTPRDMHPD
ncbi:MAG: hypothetical protein H6899_04535 [Rhodobacter sp.]|nr:hypothetical protein [Paracoccaceae bacterium]MCB1411179.1 hypothetical protein [Paracoccaceae bacterium]MCC0079215.1 hypothetical protein [Rhodobacter sp.]